MSINHFLKHGFLLAILTTTLSFGWAEDGAKSLEDAKRVKSVLEASLKADPTNSEMWAHLGYTNQKLEDIDGAQVAFEKSTQLNPKNAGALYMLSLIYEKKKMTDEALKSWKALLEVSDDQWKRDVATKHIHHLNSK